MIFNYINYLIIIIAMKIGFYLCLILLTMTCAYAKKNKRILVNGIPAGPMRPMGYGSMHAPLGVSSMHGGSRVLGGPRVFGGHGILSRPLISSYASVISTSDCPDSHNLNSLIGHYSGRCRMPCTEEICIEIYESCCYYSSSISILRRRRHH
jgi:hypothetical protein